MIDDTVAIASSVLFKANIQSKPAISIFSCARNSPGLLHQLPAQAEDLAELGGKAEVEKLAQGAANVTVRDSNGGLRSNRHLCPSAIPVCIK